MLTADNERGSGLVGYFMWLARKYPSRYARLLGRVLQLEEENADRDTDNGVYQDR
jgi:hypothetical protein